MRTRLKTLFVSTSGAIAVAFLAFSFGGAGAVRADDPEALPEARPEMVLVSAQTLDALEQRISRLEETVASLNESARHASTRQLCVADDGGAETCLTKSELDALLTGPAHAAEIAQPAPAAAAEGRPTAKEDAAIVPPANNPEPPTAAASNEEPTGSIPTGAGPAVVPNVVPDSETEGLDDGS